MKQISVQINETQGCGLLANVTMPSGRTASMMWLGDGRLVQYRQEANIEFGSNSLQLSDEMIDAVIASVDEWVLRQTEPVHYTRA